MEPISVLSALGVMLKLLTFIADAIQQSRRRIDDFKCLGKQLEKYRTSAQRCNIMLSDWSDFWNIRSTDESAAGIKRWGIEGWAVVEHTLAIIDELSIDILLLLREFHDDDKIKEQLNSIAESRAGKAQKATENGPNKLRKKMPLSIKAKNEALMALPETRRDAIQAKKDRAKANQEALALNKNFNLVFGDSEKIGKLCSELEESIVSLDRFSEKRFLVRFPHLEKSFSLYTANREADSRYRTRLLNHSEGLRKVALGLYNSCLVVEAQDLRIPIENVAIEDLEDSIRTYHVICEPKTDQARKLKLQIMKEEPIDNVYQNINDACRNAIKKVAHLVCSAELNEKDYFALEVVQGRFEVAQQSLAKLLQDTRNKIENKEKLRLFPTQEREILAYQFGRISVPLSWNNMAISAE